MGTRARAGLVRECAPRRPVMAQGIAARPLYVHISGHANLGLCMGSHFKDDAAISQAAPIPATCADEDVHPHMEEDSTTETASTPDDTLHGDADQWLLPSQQNVSKRRLSPPQQNSILAATLEYFSFSIESEPGYCDFCQHECIFERNFQEEERICTGCGVVCKRSVRQCTR